MKRTDTILLLDRFSSILKKLPHTDLLSALLYLDQLVETSINHVENTHPADTILPPEQIPLENLESSITATYKTKAQLQTYATSLGITAFTAKTTKPQLLELIIRHLRASRMQDTLRTYELQPTT
ncbi:hypothetical protein [Tumebacillus permanentifrigoris]|uniref:Uncharacterized protein n=1 Tax=Tumebacillus permanentifrigoris TaxID=378543 RepID=A0A316D403_9BACL|nr:hypothetical protein [Tumebacillus permanentifrigoris]PWK03926.1 hypothetical protein C7459_1453 [Tumebacillus permanentifrigoris]